MSKALFWFRQDLRIKDNPGLNYACQHHQEILLLYILDEKVIHTAQAWWLYHSINQLIQDLEQYQIKLVLKKGTPEQIIDELIAQYHIDAVYWNRCYEPERIHHDQQLKSKLKHQSITVNSFNSALLHEPWEIKNQQGLPFKVFTPYWKNCLARMSIPNPQSITQWPQNIAATSENLSDWQLLPTKPNWAIDFKHYFQPGEIGAQNKLQYFIEHHIHHYKDARNEPALNATSCLSPHLHFGEISPWEIVRQATHYLANHPEHEPQVAHFISELGWREFSYHLLYHFPTLNTENFKAEFNKFPWHNDHEAFKQWTRGKTGYPIVDAGMRELWHTGTMHNRVRMIVASFLIKDLFIDWRRGAEWFNQTLLDADLASNYASWQWVAGSGADAAPYFRIFNPVLQGEKFDPQGLYVRKWVPELEKVPNKWIHHPWDAPAHELNIHLGIQYPHPMVNHEKARAKALNYYQNLKDQQHD